jgi:hypothetical protein
MASMFKFSVQADMSQAIKRLDDLQRRHIPFATAKALAKTAQIVQKELKAEMGRVFDRPTRFTLSSLRVKPATKQRLEAMVYFKDTPKGTSAGDYLKPQIHGGGRVLKRFELHLQRAGILAPGFYAVPGQGARLNASGNMSPGQITQILSGIKAHPDVYARSSKASGRRNPAPLAYFVSRGGHLPYGVYQRVGATVRPVMIFIRSPNYKVRFKFGDVAQKTAAKHFPIEFRRALKDALATAR